MSRCRVRPTIVLTAPVTGSTVTMSLPDVKASNPFPATPNGDGTRFMREPTRATAAAISRAMMTSATAIDRIGRRGMNVGRLAISAMGSHLPGMAQAGRCRERVAVARTSSR